MLIERSQILDWNNSATIFFTTSNTNKLTWRNNPSSLLSLELSSLSLLLSAEVWNKGWRLGIGWSQDWRDRWFCTDFARANLTASSTAKCFEVKAKWVRLKAATKLTLGGSTKSVMKKPRISLGWNMIYGLLKL